MRISTLALVVALAVPTSAQATQFVTFGSQMGGAAAFDAAVVAGGRAVTTVATPTGSFGPTLTIPGGITVTRNNGANIGGSSVYNDGGSATIGGAIDISPAGSTRGIGAIGSGVTFNFSSPINAFGFEVGDWGTCCQPSSLFVQFDNGAPINVGTSQRGGDVFLTNNNSLVFAGAFDDSGTFSKVSFWGDGFGEYLVVGGTLRTANVNLGSIGNGSTFNNPLLPMAINPATGAFQFNFNVNSPTQTVWIDPLVASGYDYAVTSGPNILTAIFPTLGDANGYQIYSLTGGVLGGLLGTVADGGTFNFGPGGVSAFALRDISTALNLDPANPTAFITGLTFNVTGNTNISMTQTPVTTFVPGNGGAVPEPATWLSMIVGFGMLGGAMRRRQTAQVRYAF